MNRREFAGAFGLGLAGLSLGGSVRAAAARAPRVAITLDDFNLFDVPSMSAEARNRAILGALGAHSARAAMFVTGKFVDNEKGQKYLGEWNHGGHVIGNHSYSHMEYADADVTFERFSQDVLKAEAVLGRHPRFRKIFRFPYLKEGDTAAKRDAMRAFLRAHGYRNGHVTIDASDWYVDTRLRARLEKDPAADTKPYRDFYLAHIRERSLFYDDLSRRALGRSVSHTLLLHHNVLNGLFLGDLIAMFRKMGWKIISAEEAYADPVFGSAPDITPAGESLVWALAKAAGKFEKLLRYPAEDGAYERARMDALGL